MRLSRELKVIRPGTVAKRSATCCKASQNILRNADMGSPSPPAVYLRSALSDFHLFRSMHHDLANQHFSNYLEVKNWIESWPINRPISLAQNLSLSRRALILKKNTHELTGAPYFNDFLISTFLSFSSLFS